MCNLYRMTKTVDEVAKLFGVTGDSGGNFGSDVGVEFVIAQISRAR